MDDVVGFCDGEEELQCPCCGRSHGSVEFLFAAGERVKYNQYECKGCGFQFTFPPPTPKDLNDFYSDMYYSGGEQGDGRYEDYDAQCEYTLRFLREKLAELKNFKNGRLLDVGCAKGRFMHMAADEFGFSCTGIELSDFARDCVRKAYGGRFQTYKTIQDMPDSQDPYDVILLLDVVEHVNSPWEIFWPLFQKGCVGASTQILLSTPNVSSASATKDLQKWEFRYPPAHLSFCRPETFGFIAKQLLFRQCVISGHSPLPGIESRLLDSMDTPFSEFSGLYCVFSNSLLASLPADERKLEFHSVQSSSRYGELAVEWLRFRTEIPRNLTYNWFVRRHIASLEREKALLTQRLVEIERSRTFHVARKVACFWGRLNSFANVRNLLKSDAVQCYSVIASIGVNCEVSFHLNRIFGFVDSYPLAWAFVDEVGNLPKFLVNPAIAFASKNVVHDYSCNMCFYPDSGIHFHCQGGPETLLELDGKVSPRKAQEALDELASRMSYLSKKWLTLMNDPSRSVLCVLTPWDRTQTREILDVLDVLEKFPNVRLLVVLTGAEHNISAEAIIQHGAIVRYIGFHPPHDAVTDLSKNDVASWNRIFAEFRPTEVRKKGKKLKYEH